MIINGVELDLDFTDADVIERIEKERKDVIAKAEELQKGENLDKAEGIRQICKIIKDFFDYVVGDGTSEKLFGNKNSLAKCLQAFEDIAIESQKQINDFEVRVSKYSPDRCNR